MRPSTLTLKALCLAVAVGFALAAAPAAAAEPAAVHLIRTEPGDTLIGLGQRYLRDPSRWPEIARLNRLPNPNRIGVGVELQIPLQLMHLDPAPATVLNAVGEARGGAEAARAGQTLPEGSEVITGADGHVTLRLVDGTLLRLRPSSRLRLDESRRIRDTPATRSGARVDGGRVEVEAAPASAGQPGFRIGTPQGVLGVRGTEFRVAADEAGTRGEVLGGVVAVDGQAGTPGQTVSAGFGTVVDPNGRVASPVRLLEAPITSALPTLQERILVRFTLPALAGAAAWRGQVSRDARFDEVLADLSSASPELRFAGLPDGDYVLRVRAVDAQGLEGRDADHRFRLKARPEAPLPSAPAPRAVIFGSRADFTWAANSEAASYELQLATEDRFDAPLRVLTDLRALDATIEGLAPGTYHWRLRSRRGDGDPGPWGASRSFDLRPLPPAPKPPAVGDNAVAFSWEGGAGQSWDFEVAHDSGFTDKVFERRLDRPEIMFPRPGSGRFHVRLRAREADGFVGPWGATQHFDIEACLRDASGACVRGAADRPLILNR